MGSRDEGGFRIFPDQGHIYTVGYYDKLLCKRKAGLGP